MAPPQVRLDEAEAQLVDAIGALCDAARAPGGLLEDIEEVVSGDRARRRPDPPYLWVVVAASNAEDTHALHAKWTSNVMLSAFVQSESPEDGWMEARRYAARAASVVIADRDLGLDFVQDTQPSSLENIGQLRRGKRFGAFARLDVIYTIRE